MLLLQTVGTLQERMSQITEKYGEYKSCCFRHRNNEAGKLLIAEPEPRDSAGKSVKSEGQLEEGVVEVISSTCWYIPGSVQGVTTDFLIDSGSTYTIIDEDLYYAIPDHQRSPLEQISLILRSANGETLNVCGQATVAIELGREIFVYSVKVVTLGDKSAILGLDFMDEEDCVLHMSKGILQINSKSIRLSLHKQTDSKCARIQLAERLCIPPMNEMIVPGKINQRHRNFDESIGSVEPIKKICDATGLLVARTLVSTANNDVPIRLANTSAEPIVLEKGHTIALLHPVDADNIQVFGTCAQIGSGEKQLLPQHLKSMIEKLSPELSGEEVKRVEDLLGKYKDSFTDADGKVGKTHLVRHTIMIIQVGQLLLNRDIEEFLCIKGTR